MITDEIRFTTDLPDRGRYVSLFISTGWNDDYRFTEDRSFESVVTVGTACQPTLTTNWSGSVGSSPTAFCTP